MIFRLEVRSIFGSQKIAEFYTEASGKLNFAKAVIGIDPSSELARFNQPISEINKIGLLEGRRRALIEQHELRPIAPSTDHLEENVETIDASLEALSWTRQLVSLAPRPTVRKLLLSGDALRIRQRILAFYSAVEADLVQLDGLLEKFRSLYSIEFAEQSIEGLSTKASVLFDRHSEIYEVVAIKQWQETIEEFGLASFVSAAFAADIPPDDIPQLYEAYLARQQVDQIRRDVPALGKASGGILEAHRTAFADRDRAKQKDDRASVRSSLISRQPAPGTNAGPKRGWTEMGMLKNEFQKQARFVPVRTLVRRAPQSLQSLKPCFMMSPLSLAKFVPPDGLEFDLLVIDEASQMRPEDAFGAFLRCRQVVVVGDAKQLPPTEFFNRANEDDSSWEDTEDDSDDTAESCWSSAINRLAKFGN